MFFRITDPPADISFNKDSWMEIVLDPLTRRGLSVISDLEGESLHITISGAGVFKRYELPTSACFLRQIPHQNEGWRDEDAIAFVSEQVQLIDNFPHPMLTQDISFVNKLN